MSTQSLQEDQLLELLLHLKKTTPDEARAILNSQPQIAYALMAVLVNISAVDMGVVQKTIAAYSTQAELASTSAPQPGPSSAPITPPIPAIPPYVSQQTLRGGTPAYPPHRGGTPTYPAQQPPHTSPSYSTPPQPGFGAPSSTGQIPGLDSYPPQPLSSASSQTRGGPSQSAAAILAAALQKVPDEQKPLVMRIISMTRDEIFAMPAAERDNIIKLRTTLGLIT